MVMKRVHVAKLKAGLSHYLRLVQKGEHVLVLDRKKPVAELVGVPGAETVWQRLALEGRCKVGTQRWDDFEPPRLEKSVPIEKILRDLGADAE